MLEIQHIPKTFMIHQGDLVDQFGGVPQDGSKLTAFFEKAKGLSSGQASEDKSQTSTSAGGLVVEKLNEGSGPVVPKGALVKVHYTGKLTDGTVFDSSVSRGEPLEFQVGIGRVIRGWDEGICQLQKGQKAVLTCPPDYAYGPRGVPGVIPPNATLIFEVEVVSFVAG